MPPGSRAFTPLALALILIVAGALRFHGLNWDDGHHLHPDERFLAIVGDKIRFPDRLLTYFDTARSPLNPYNQGFDGFAYGTAPLFLTRALAELLDMASYDQIHLVGRALSALFDLGTIVLTFLLGRLVFGTAVGLVAAAILAVTVLHVQLAHFFAVDTFLTFCTTLALYGGYRAWTRGGVLSFALLGLGLGLGLATKLSAALLLPIVGLIALVPPPTGARGSVGRRAALLGVCGLVALLVYRVGEPYSFAATSPLGFRPNEQRFTDLNRWVKISSGEIEVPYMIQWAGTARPWFALGNLATWGFGPVGLAGLAGLAFAAIQLRQWRAHGLQLLLVAWAALNLAYFGFQFAKFMRYLLPVYPALAILAASLLVLARNRSARQSSLPVRLMGSLAAPLVLGAGALYAVMFSSIYARPNTRVQASDWIYANVPLGSTLAVEHWDDALPLNLPGRERRFTEVSLALYDDEAPQKARQLADNLRRADYVILASNRLYDSIPRLPRRFPIAVEYYRLLFGGGLGFDLVTRFEAKPVLLGLAVDDSSAQEDFTVYDHPTVLIFRKSATFSGEAVAAQLAAVSLDGIERTKPVEAGAARGRGLTLGPAEWERVLAGGTWSEMFAMDGLAARWALPIWLLVVELLALAALPLCRWLFPDLGDRGFALSKLLGVLFVSYPSWLLASLQIAPFGRGLVLVCAALLGGCGLACAIRRRGAAGRAVCSWQALLVTESVFLGAFAFMLLIRLFNPDLWHPTFGGEKPMDFAYLNAVVKSASFPPYDPWYAGGYINYYYWGLVVVAVLTHLSTLQPHLAYNLAVPTVFALTAVGAFAFGSSLLAGRRGARIGRLPPMATAAGLASAAAVRVLGNLDGAIQIRDGLWKLGSDGLPSVLPALTGASRAVSGLLGLARGEPLPPFDFWRSTRFIGPEDPGPIHEFPFFTFLYGDLHAHMLALPLQVAVVLVALQLVRLRPPRLWGATSGATFENVKVAAWGRPVVLLLVAALLVGALRGTNTWDFPLYLLLSAAALALMLRPARVGWGRAAIAGGLGAAALYAISSLLFLPYLINYELFYSGVEPVKAVTDPGQFVAIHGLLLGAAVGWLGAELGRAWPALVGPTSTGPSGYYGVLVPAIGSSSSSRATIGTALALAASFGLAANGRGVLGLVLMVGVAGTALALVRTRSSEILFGLTLGAAALGALTVPELVAVRGDVGRMNTVFKFYLQAWVLLGLLAGPAVILAARALWGSPHIGSRRRLLPEGWRPEGRRPEGQRASGATPLVLALGFLVACAAVYPLLATPVKLGLRFAPLPPTLDGMAFMASARHQENGRDLDLPADRRAIDWVLQNIAGTPVILEGQAPLYHWGSRFATYTGLPTILGWDWHQRQQRWGYQAHVQERQRDVATLYETASIPTARALLARYGVSYVVVGGLERAYYPAVGLAKFEGMVDDGLEVAYRDGGVTIYRLVGN